MVLHSSPQEIKDARLPLEQFDQRVAAMHVASVFGDSVSCSVRGEVREILELIDAHKPDVVFNLRTAPFGRLDLMGHVVALLEWMGIRFAGNRSGTLQLSSRKSLLNAVLRGAGIPVPAKLTLAEPFFPCIVRSDARRASAGLTRESVCEDAEALARAVARLDAPALIQEFLPGREFSVGLWGRSDPEDSAIGETVFQQGLRLMTHDAKWNPESEDFANAPAYYDSDIAPALRESVLAVARGAWKAVGARHAAIVDVRLDRDGRPRVIDLDPSPEFAPGTGISLAVEETGGDWYELVRKLVDWA
jgi:D-alanine-D-alanine ligase-like ATP-grasp enzyme